MPARNESVVEAPSAVSRAEETLDRLAEQYRLNCHSLFTAALRLPVIEKQFSTAWPASVRSILPSTWPGTDAQSTWAPVLGWILLESVPVSALHPWLFDHLYLRPALAEIFSSLGIESGQTWRLAAQVRVLLRWRGLSALATPEFWQDADVRWLGGVNHAEGVDYIRKEGLEELACWLALPALVDLAAGQKSGQESDLKVIEAQLTHLCSTAKAAGYRLEVFLAHPE
uniref:Uncharacterized protein n=1 Tax=mine drainage metagenome TaxID=410659 RepID=E6QLI0_9ZZZZ